jgi:hypothetical protein
MSADTNNYLTDYATGLVAVLPTGAMVESVALHANGSVSGDAVLRVGTVADNQSFFAESDNVSSQSLNSNDVSNRKSGLVLSTTSDSNIVIYPVSNSVSGYIDVLVKYGSFS